MGSYLVATLPAAVFLTISERGIVRRIISGLILGLGLIMLAYTRSRASWLAFLCMPILVAGWLTCQRRQRGLLKSFFSRRQLIGLAALAAAALAAGGLRGEIIMGRQSVGERFQALLQMATEDDPNNSFGIRLAYNLNGMAMVRDRPLRGVGLGAFHTAYPAYYRAIRPTPAGGFSTRERPTRMHNDLGQAFVELGIPGGLAYIMIFAGLLWTAWRTGRRAESREASLMSLCLITAVCGLGLNALADFPLQLPMSSVILWSYAGMITGLYVIHAGTPDVGSRRSRRIPRLAYVVLVILFAIGGWAVWRDDLARRRGAQYLKGVMTLANAGRFDESTLLLLRKSMEHYQWDARLQDYRALVYANYRGEKINVNTHERVSQVEAATRHDPYSPHKLINLGGLYIIRAHELIAADAGAQALKYARQAENVFETMLNYPDFFADRTYVLGGMANLLQAGLQPAEAAERIPRARALLDKALKINPRNQAAREALARIGEAAGGSNTLRVPVMLSST